MINYHFKVCIKQNTYIFCTLGYLSFCGLHKCIVNHVWCECDAMQFSLCTNKSFLLLFWTPVGELLNIQLPTLFVCANIFTELLPCAKLNLQSMLPLIRCYSFLHNLYIYIIWLKGIGDFPLICLMKLSANTMNSYQFYSYKGARDTAQLNRRQLQRSAESALEEFVHLSVSSVERKMGVSI